MKFLFAPLGWVLAHTSRCVEIAKVLRSRGHDVVFIGEDPSHPRSKLSLVEDAGFRLIHAKEPYQPYGWDRFEKYGFAICGWDLLRLNKWVPLQEIIEKQVRIIEQEKPNIIVGDASVSASTAAYIAGIPAAGILNGYASHFLTPDYIFHPALQAYDRLHLARLRKRAFKTFGKKPVNSLNLLRSIPLISPDLHGLYDNPKFFPNYHTVGPIFAEHPSPLPEWFDELGDGRINVYITMGSTGFLDTFLRRTYNELSRLPYRFIVTTARQVREETARMAPPNFRLCEYAPGSQILKHCSALIFHGGNGTMYQALGAGVPMIALPSHHEQEAITRICVNNGFCLRMNARGFRTDDLAKNLRRIIEEQQFREAAEQFSHPVRNANGAEQAADLLDRCARAGVPAGADL
ncbi:MAG: glycosyltransferase [Candidatus Hydrogenedentes bacterium]|nr:glycosyltransferase [Candidatus Hydrogenedentota bacterium]